MNSILIMVALMSWGATETEAIEETSRILAQHPALEYEHITAEMLEYSGEIKCEEGEYILRKIK